MATPARHTQAADPRAVRAHCQPCAAGHQRGQPPWPGLLIGERTRPQPVRWILGPSRVSGVAAVGAIAWRVHKADASRMLGLHTARHPFVSRSETVSVPPLVPTTSRIRCGPRRCLIGGPRWGGTAAGDGPLRCTAVSVPCSR
ncbi:MAG: hypothetical protein JWN47_283 [Frankiales bacterium]|nr:hypothetical protein [Frankiales bacterium]